MQVDSRNTPWYFVGLTPEERRAIVLQAAKEQQKEIDQVLGALFVEVDRDSDGFTGPLGEVARQAVARNKPKTVTPAEFWNKQEEQRRQNQTQNGLALTPKAPASNGLLSPKPIGVMNAKPIGGQGPLAFSQRGGVTGTPKLGGANPVPTLGASPQVGFRAAPAPIKTINLSDIVGSPAAQNTGDVVGNLIDIFA